MKTNNKKTVQTMMLNNSTAKSRLFDLNAITRAMSFGFLMSLTTALVLPAIAMAGDGHDHAAEELVLVKAQVMQDDGHGHDEEAVKDDGHGHGAEEAKEAEEDVHGIELTPAQLALAKIEVAQLSEQTFSLEDVATATLVVDRDRTVTIAPQVDVRVLKRNVVPGQEVAQGDVLLTLGGVAVAQAQADYINAAAEWSRVKRMSASAVSASRRLQAQVDAELKRAILEAMKMTPMQIKALANAPETIGSYQLIAPISGRVQQDIALLGQIVPAGTALMQLTDESHLWVEAELTPTQAEKVSLGSKTVVKVGDKSIEGTIIGRSHELDSVTRTEQILVAFENAGHVLHAGQFAELYLPDASQGGVILPDSALTRSSDGHWQVFIEGEEGFEALEVEVVERQRGMNLVRGLAKNAKVVVSGAFFLASEQAKSGFDIHNH
ncbi:MULTISPECIES: efflux RND transporter periplasmic adaptor subunit [unclassified Shewanella]|uniref:efflux RND transporter periplasmic adaptor subunit n=1 Tax=unclassified Shewanella TaxID=196818 RepID=UPI001BC43DA4|nr:MULTISPECIES: efflux RND transporter periplasmic adaptor subunit [unclassified Shewanella]GIU06404.1 RND transporter MFP subunit [Shewanella sp. MBTL60-112-B1]GIU26853.1 RND transporter MFP subunit [Shewanella sp. MBTL60-112-B2]